MAKWVKKKFNVLVFILLLCLCLFGCNEEGNKQNDESKKDIDVSMVTLDDGTYVYNNQNYSLECSNVPNGVRVEYQGNNQK